MNPSSSCPLCHSADVGDYGNDGSAVIWCICFQCTHLWVRTLSTTDMLDVAGSSERGAVEVTSVSSREMTDIITRDLEDVLVALNRVRA